MALDLGTLVGFLDLDAAKFERKLDGVDSKFGKFATGLGVVAAAGVAAAGAAVAGFAVAGVKEFGKFEKGMNEVFTLLPGMSEDAMGEMSDDTRKFVREMGVAHDEAVPALYSALSAGVPKDSVFEFMEVAAQAAKGGVTDLNTAVDGITSVVNSYGDSLSGAGEASDLMFTAVRLGKTSFEELSNSLFQVNPTAAALGVGFEDVTAALATMTAQGVPTSVATTQLRQAFVELSKDGGKTAATFEKISGKTFKDFIAGGGNTQEALQLLEKHAKDTGVGVNDLFGSVEAGGAALALTGGNTDSFTHSIAEMAGSAGATEAAFGQMDQGLDRSWEKIKIGVTDAALGFGEQLAPAIQLAADWVGEKLPGALETLGAAFQGVVDFLTTTLPAAFTTVAGFYEQNEALILGIAAVITAVLLPALVRSSIAHTVETAKKVAAWALVQGAAIRAGITYVIQSALIVAQWVIMAVGATVNGIKIAAVWTAQIIGSAVRGATAMAVQAALVVAQWVVMSVGASVNAIKMAASWVVGVTVPAAAGAATMAATAAGVVAKWLLMSVQSLLHAGRMAAAWFIALGPVGWVIGAIIGLVALVIANWDKISKFTSEAWGNIVSFITGAIENIKSGVRTGIDNVINFFVNLPGRILGALGNLGSLLLGAGGQILDGFLSGLTAGFEKVKNFVGGIGSWIANNKGPKAYDLALLVPAGGWIMDGLNKGIQKSMPELGSTLGDVSWMVANGIDPELSGSGNYAFTGTAAGASDGAAATTVQLHPEDRALLRAVASRDNVMQVDGREIARANITGRKGLRLPV